MHRASSTCCSSKYKSAGQTWAGTIQKAATNLFWLLATISLGWTCVSMAIKQSDLVEIVAELCRFIMFTGFFFWLLPTGRRLPTRLSNRCGRSGAMPRVQVNRFIQEI